MARLTRPLLRLIAAVLLLQTVVAPAHCLAMAAAPAGMEAVICTAEGMRTVHLGPDGQEMPAGHEHGGFCLACHALPQAAAAAPPAVSEPIRTATAVAWERGTTEGLPPEARGPPYRPTGPPSLS